MRNKIHLVFERNNSSIKNKKFNIPLKLYNSNDNIKQIFSDKLKNKIKSFNNSNYSSNNNSIYRQTNYKKKYKKEKLIKLSFSKNSQTTLKNYNYKYNSRNKFLNNSFFNFKIIKKKNRIFNSYKEINEHKKLFKIFENNSKINQLNSNKSLSRINDFNHHFLLDKKDIDIKNKENDSMNFSRINKFEISKDFNNHNKSQKYNSEIDLFNIYNNTIKDNKQFKNLKKNSAYKKYNNIFLGQYFFNLRLKKNKVDWKNNILESVISNITKNYKNGKDMSFYDDNYNHRNIKMFTILDLYNKNHKSLKSLKI